MPLLGKGDLVGCDISVHLAMQSNGGGNMVSSSGSGGDFVVKSSCDVKALTYCDLKCIHMQGLVDVLRLYPEYQQEFAHDIQHDLTYNLREGYEAEVMNGIEFYSMCKSYTCLLLLCGPYTPTTRLFVYNLLSL